jgi:hypothetical protein
MRGFGVEFAFCELFLTAKVMDGRFEGKSGGRVERKSGGGVEGNVNRSAPAERSAPPRPSRG